MDRDRDVASLRSSAGPFLSGAVGLLGVGGILYAMGYLTLRSHYSFLGIWGGVPLTSSEIADEGGRFLFHFLYAPIDLLWPFSGPSLLLLTAISLVLVAWDVSPLLRWNVPRLHSGHERRRSTSTAVATVLFLFFVTAVLLETVWQVVQLDDVLRTPNTVFRNARLHDAARRSALYDVILGRTLLAAAIAWLLSKRFWAGSGSFLRFMIIVQWAFVIAAIFTLPVAHGRLLMPTTYRLIGHPGAPAGDTLVLIALTDDAWIAWNVRQQRTEVLPRAADRPVWIGQPIDLLQPR
jgi:hypothetical protein